MFDFGKFRLKNAALLDCKGSYGGMNVGLFLSDEEG